MMKNVPRISKWIGRGYLILAVSVVVLFAAIFLSANIYSTVYAGILLTALMVFASVLLVVVTYGFYKTSYVVKNGSLYSWSPFAVINIPIKDIAEIERTRIPFYFKGIGASLYSGRFYVHGLGWVKTIMTNLTDGVLITDRNRKHYLITPSNPDLFIKSCK